MDNVPFALLVKPVSFDCNLRCKYCFYLQKVDMFGAKKHLMSDVTLKNMIIDYFNTEQQTYSLGWQGGEPTLAGLEFFQKAVDLMQTYGRPGARVANALQTNGTLLDDNWGKFLAKYHFLVGVSVDGPPEIHNLNRSNSHDKVLNGIEALRRNNVEFNILTLVNSTNVKEPLKVYRYIRDELKVDFHQYIECVEFDSQGNLRDYAITPKEWGDFLCAIFDEWYNNDSKNVSIRLFDSILHKIIHDMATTCTMSKKCGQYLVVEHDGGVYPCDFFVRPELQLGNVNNSRLVNLLDSSKARTFFNQKLIKDKECKNCKFQKFCAGDCVKNRREGKSFLCEGWKQFYSYTLDRFVSLIKK